MFEILFSEGVEEDLVALRAHDRMKVLDTIEEQLAHEPTKPTRQRKLLSNLAPPFEAVPPIWELRVGEYRVFYDVNEDAGKVYVRAARHKPPHRTTEEIL